MVRLEVEGFSSCWEDVKLSKHRTIGSKLASLRDATSLQELEAADFGPTLYDAQQTSGSTVR